MQFLWYCLQLANLSFFKEVIDVPKIPTIIVYCLIAIPVIRLAYKAIKRNDDD